MPFNLIFALYNNGKAIYAITLLFLIQFPSQLLQSLAGVLIGLTGCYSSQSTIGEEDPGPKMLSRHW